MARELHKLTDVAVKAAVPRRHGDGGGLWLEVTSFGSRAWLFIWKAGGRRNAMGLGGYPGVSLKRARELATEKRNIVSRGGNPLAESRRAAEPTFAEAVDLFLADNKPAWRNTKQDDAGRRLLPSPSPTAGFRDIHRGRLAGAQARLADQARNRFLPAWPH